MRKAIILVFLPALLVGQILGPVTGGGGGGGAATSIAPVTVATLPATCALGDIRYVTDATVSAGLIRRYVCPTTNTWVQEGYVAGGSGAVAVQCSSPPCTIDVTSAVPLKASANAYTGSNDYSGATKTAMIRIGATDPVTCDATVREQFFNTTSNTLKTCNAANTWASVGTKPGCVRTVTGATDTILTTDNGCLVRYTATAANVAITLPTAGSAGFTAPFEVKILAAKDYNFSNYCIDVTVVSGTIDNPFVGIASPGTTVKACSNMGLDILAGAGTSWNTVAMGPAIFNDTGFDVVFGAAPGRNMLFGATPVKANNFFLGGFTTILGSSADANFRLGAADSAAPVSQTLSVQNVVAGSTNTAGANTVIALSGSTGTGVGGGLTLTTSRGNSTSGSAVNAPYNTFVFGTIAALGPNNNNGYLQIGDPASPNGGYQSIVLGNIGGSNYGVGINNASQIWMGNFNKNSYEFRGNKPNLNDSTAGYIAITDNNPYLATTGEANTFLPNINVAPTSGTAAFNAIKIAHTVNQTGGASGISRGIYINPTLTAAADWRAIQAVGKIVFGGTAAPAYVTIAPTTQATAGSTLFIQDATPTTGQTGMVIKSGAVSNTKTWDLQNNAGTSQAYFSDTGNLTVVGDTQMRSLIGGSAATIAVGTGAGTSPTNASAGSDLDGLINITTGTLPVASATVATITFTSTKTSAPACTFSPAGPNTALLSGTSMVYLSASTTVATFTAGATALAAATQYKWAYHCIQN